MDLLGGYGSESEDDKEQQEALKPPEPAAVPQKVVTAFLPNPFSAEPATTTSVANKRPFTAVVGHSLPAAANKHKDSKKHAADRPAPKGKKGEVLLPPQLAGRANVVTEDTEKLFGKVPPAPTRSITAGAECKGVERRS